ncbi:MAG: efflux RND transporter periplasmic adaptor subunit [Gammaproteobacteria bacterium]|jgi:RND family efflux transporter MFP subunit
MIRALLWLMLLLPATSGAATPVTLKALGDLWFDQEQSAPASVIALNAPVISSELNARVVRVHVESGDQVKAGDPLVQLDCRLSRANLLAAEAGLRQFEAQYSFARRQVRRADDLIKKRNISEQEVEQRESEEQRLAAQIDAQKAAIRQAEIAVGNCQVNAPFDGVVTQRMAETGMLAAVGTPLLRLVQSAPLEVSASLNPAEATVVVQSDSLHFESDGKRYPVALRTIVPYIDETTRTREARLRFRNAAPIPGAAGRLVWLVSSKSIPAEYLLRRNGRLGIFSYDEGKARFMPAENALEGQPAIVDLPPGTLVIDQGRESINDGDLVKDARQASEAAAGLQPVPASDSDR